MNKPPTVTTRRARSTPPPAHLAAPEAALWRSLAAEYAFTDPASLALLQSAMESHQRARKCREAVDADGETLLDRFQQVKPHPLLAAERDARAAFLAAMRLLRLDVTGDVQ